jgi:Ribbon-helix-helix protein, copG family
MIDQALPKDGYCLRATKRIPSLPMETVTLKLDRRHIQILKDRAKATGRSQAAVIRELIEQHLGGDNSDSLHDRAKDLCGSVSGSKNMSTRKLRGYGNN